jgi:hypothetical protein
MVQRWRVRRRAVLILIARSQEGEPVLRLAAPRLRLAGAGEVRLEIEVRPGLVFTEGECMYSVNGWFTLVLPESDWERESAILGELRGSCGAFEGTNIDVRWQQLNYRTFLTIAGNANHLRTHAADVHELLRLVGERMPESFGLLYESDDERQEPPGPDAHRVTVMIRGQLEDRMDPFFSPNVPLLEGPDWVATEEDDAEAWSEYYDAICLPVEFRGVDLARCKVVGVEWRGESVELRVELGGVVHAGAGRSQYGVVRWSRVSDLYCAGRLEGALTSVAGSHGVYRVQAGAGVLTVKAVGMRVDFGGTAGR